MIGKLIDAAIGVLSPQKGLQRMQARKLMRSFTGAEASRLTNHRRPKNQSADSELLGPFGADALRAWGRELVRNNAYAWGVVDTIVSSVVGLGISAQSMVETPEGDDVEDANESRDKVWSEWCEVCDINGQLTFAELQQMAQREIVEAGEVIIHLVNLPSKNYRGIYRPVPLALEIIEADRIAVDRDTYQAGRQTENRIIRGIEQDELGRPIAYWIYPEHPNSPYINKNQSPKRIDAKHILHLFRRDRVGQSRGVTWFAPVMSWLRDLGVYVDNEIQASAVAACFGVAIKTNGPVPGLIPPGEADSQDVNGNTLEYLEPAMVTRLMPGESIESINPGRPNSASEPWISLMLRGIAVGTGLSYEIVARDYSKTSYSSSRTSQLEDRRRFRRWQRYLVNHLCQPVWDRFCEQAALAGVDSFPSMADLLEDRRAVAPVEWQTTEWEWVDPQSEQTASTMAIDNFQSTLQSELGQRGKNWRSVLYQRSKEQRLKRELGLISPSEAQSVAMVGAAAPTEATTTDESTAATGEWMGLSRLQWTRNRKALQDILDGLANGVMSAGMATAQLAMLGLTQQNIEAIISDATDGTIDNPLPAEEVTNA
jgi:lambda family phage portal protein